MFYDVNQENNGAKLSKKEEIRRNKINSRTINKDKKI